MLKKFMNYAGNESGNVAMMFSLGAVVMLTVTGAAVDYSNLVNSQTRLQSLTDQLSLAVGAELKSGNITFDDMTTMPKPTWPLMIRNLLPLSGLKPVEI